MKFWYELLQGEYVLQLRNELRKCVLSQILITKFLVFVLIHVLCRNVDSIFPINALTCENMFKIFGDY